MQNARKKGWYIRSGSFLDNLIHFTLGSATGLAIGAIIAYGMNEIHPLF